MSITSKASNSCLLTYAINTNPEPLQTSPSVGTLTIIVSNTGTQAIYADSISFSFDIGDLAQDLTSVSTGILVSASPSEQWQIASTSAGVFTATPVQPQCNEITTNGLTFQIYNIQVNNQVGTFSLSVSEYSSTDNKNFSYQTNAYQVTKFPYGFYVSNFTANEPMVTDGGTVTLTWAGAEGAAYYILYGTTSPVDVSEVRTWTSPALTQDTTFYLQASVQAQGQTVTTYLNTSVNVANPNLNATTLSVLQGTALQGNTSVGTSGAPANLGVNGAFTTTGNASFGGNATVGGTATLATAGVTGALTVGGNSTLASALIQGGFTVQGAVSMISGAQGIGTGTYMTHTDGLVVGYVSGTSNCSNYACGFIACQTPNTSAQILGGNTCCYLDSNGTFGMANNPQSLVLPVQSGMTWSVGASYSQYNQDTPPVGFWWVPIGAGTTAEQTPVRLSDRQPDMPASFDVVQSLTSRDNVVAELVELLGEVLEASLAHEHRTRFADFLSKLRG